MKKLIVVLALMVTLVFSGAAFAWAAYDVLGDDGGGIPSDEQPPVIIGDPGGDFGDGLPTTCSGPMLPGGSWDMD